jgi:phosphoglycerate dehydrogenase-like enzyme
MDNVVATPHMGATSWENWELRVKNVWNNVQRVWEGEEPKNQVREF